MVQRSSGLIQGLERRPHAKTVSPAGRGSSSGCQPVRPHTPGRSRPSRPGPGQRAQDAINASWEAARAPPGSVRHRSHNSTNGCDVIYGRRSPPLTSSGATTPRCRELRTRPAPLPASRLPPSRRVRVRRVLGFP
ncbi:hypothetical protein NDU88_000098 [Pleurodeles waltl]|uniref:Uncharacterized protein n=1 Tax=Pleurodeles waltl TaxID=8319 RepID=A0AAV7SVM0_PLEWA|nr:hypothetical protein NDU88_000098 [Pleurodeles waltl]